MITDIEISNFQGYKDASFSLSSGLNVITGESDTGKSSIIRLLTWIFKNRPKGDSFRNNSMKKKDSVLGSVAFDDGSWVTREKGKNINSYLLPSSDTPLKALRTDVPTEVSDITKIADVNLQSQHPNEQYFMLTDSPGQVAKHFNKVAGLTIMDDALSKINSSVRKNKQEADFLTTLINDKKEKVKSLSWVNKAVIDIDAILSLEKTINELDNKADELDDILCSYNETMDVIKKYKNIDSALKKISSLEKTYDEHQHQRTSHKKIMEYVNDVYKLDKELESTLLLKTAAIEFYALKNVINAVKKAKGKLVDLTNIFNSVDDVMFDLGSIEKEINTCENELAEFDGKTCPICGGTI